MKKTRNHTATELLINNSPKLKADFSNLNSIVKSIIIDFNDGKGEIIINNDNFKTKRKYTGFSPKKYGLHEMQIVFGGIWAAANLDDQAYINNRDEISYFADLLNIKHNYIVALRDDDFGDFIYIAENGFTNDASKAKKFTHKRLAKKAAFELINSNKDILEAFCLDCDLPNAKQCGYRKIDDVIKEVKY